MSPCCLNGLGHRIYSRVFDCVPCQAVSSVWTQAAVSEIGSGRAVVVTFNQYQSGLVCWVNFGCVNVVIYQDPPTVPIHLNKGQHLCEIEHKVKLLQPFYKHRQSPLLLDPAASALFGKEIAG